MTAQEKLCSLGYAARDDIAEAYGIVPGLESLNVHVCALATSSEVPMDWKSWPDLHERCGNTQHLPQSDPWRKNASTERMLQRPL